MFYITDLEICPTFSIPLKTPVSEQQSKSDFRILSRSGMPDCLAKPRLGKAKR